MVAFSAMVFVDASCGEDEDLTLIEALGMIELAMAVLMSEDDS